MVENNKLLVLRLEGILQSWGENAKWDFRDTSTMPTKSGIIGLLGCALGEPRNSPELPHLAQEVTVAVRADRSGVKFTDYQTIQGNPLLTAEGKKRTEDTIVSPHSYLQDACFTVFIKAPASRLCSLQSALSEPKWCLYLGRKNCVPTRPIFECITDDYESLLDAVFKYPAAPRADKEMVFECEESYEEAPFRFLRSDNLVAQNRQFSSRKVWRGVVKGGTRCI